MPDWTAEIHDVAGIHVDFVLTFEVCCLFSLLKQVLLVVQRGKYQHFYVYWSVHLNFIFKLRSFKIR